MHLLPEIRFKRSLCVNKSAISIRLRFEIEPRFTQNSLKISSKLAQISLIFRSKFAQNCCSFPKAIFCYLKFAIMIGKTRPVCQQIGQLDKIEIAMGSVILVKMGSTQCEGAIFAKVFAVE